MVLLLRDREVREVLAGQEAVNRAIDMVERSIALAYQGDAGFGHTTIMCPNDATFYDAEFVLSVTWGTLPEVDVAGGRMMGINQQSRHRSTVDPDRLDHWRPVWETSSGELAALMVDATAAEFVVGAHVAVATRHLARPDARAVGVIGSGRLATASLRFIAAVRPLSRVRVYSPDPERRGRLADLARSELGIADALAVAEPRLACQGADIVTCGTNSHQRLGPGRPVLSAEWIEPGTHVNCIAPWECSEELHLRSKVVPASRAYVESMGARFDPTASMLRAGAIPDAHLPGDLLAVVAGGVEARTDPGDITVYIGPSLGFEHAAVSRLVLDLARVASIGTEWDPR